ncbi:MAG: response regulator [Alphaproteobacteria bacterium]
MSTQMLDMSNLRFLIIDENSNMRTIVKQILRAFDVRPDMIKEIDGGAEAFTNLKTFNADIIITSWMMSPINGVEFTKMLRTSNDSPNPMVPVIMLSGYTEVKFISEARDSGITEFLAIPISPKSLYLRIAEVIMRPRQFVETKDFFGPDRHRHSDDTYKGELRRDADKEKEIDTKQDPAWELD